MKRLPLWLFFGAMLLICLCSFGLAGYVHYIVGTQKVDDLMGMGFLSGIVSGVLAFVLSDVEVDW